MRFARVTQPAVGIALLVAAPPAAASEVSYHLHGVVTRVSGSATSGLRALGVKKHAIVYIDWTVETTTPVHSYNPAVNTTEYWATTANDGLTSFTIQIGAWTATGIDPDEPNAIAVNRVIVGDGTATSPAQTLDVSRSMSDTGTLVSEQDRTAMMVLNLLAPSGGASTSEALGDQTPSLYGMSTGYVVGSGGEVDFAIGGPDPTAKCRASQLASVGALCQSTLGCLATHARAPAKDPLDEKLDACRAKASDRFVRAFDDAAASAATHGLRCGANLDGAAVATDFDTAVNDVVGVVDSVQPQDRATISSWYANAAAMCRAAASAESRDAAKPSPARLDALRQSAREKLIAAADKALARAEKKGVVFDPEPDVPALVDSLDGLIDDISAEINGS